MPAKSRKQQRYLYANFGSNWVHMHHFDKLRPKRKAKKK